MTVQPPLTNLQSFNANALIFAYAIDKKNARQLMQRLSKNSIAYYYKHKLVIQEFFKNKPKFTRVLEFDPDGLHRRFSFQPWFHECPTLEEYREFEENRAKSKDTSRLMLSSVNYKISHSEVLVGI